MEEFLQEPKVYPVDAIKVAWDRYAQVKPIDIVPETHEDRLVHALKVLTIYLDKEFGLPEHIKKLIADV